MMIPLVMTNGGGRGDQGYLEWVLRQAQQYNQRVVLLGNAANAHLDVEHYDYADFYAEAKRFFEEEYVQYSYYREGYDRFTMAIFFILKDFMQTMGLPVIANTDSDMMIYCDMTEEERKLSEDYLLACCIPEYQPPFRWNASTETSFFTLEGVCEVCEFIHRVYTTPAWLAKIESKWDWHVTNEKPGGVCDLTLLYLFVQGRKRERIVNLTPPIDSPEGGTFSHKITGDENSLRGEYRMDGKLKEIRWEGGKPHGWNLRLGAWVRFKDIHLQGSSKRLAASFYREAE